MPKLRHLLPLLLAAASWLSPTACISYRQGLLPVAPPSAASDSRPTLAVLVTVKREVNGGPGALPANYVEAWKQQVVAGFTASGVFSEVKRGLGNADLQARVDIADRTSASRGFTYLSGSSFLLIPLRSQDDFTMTTTFEKAERKVIGALAKRERVTTLYQLFLAPLSLFASRDRVVNGVLRDLAQATAQEARSKGIL